MNNDLCLVPGAIDQYIPRATFDLLYPGEIPAATMPAKSSEQGTVNGAPVEVDRIVDRWFKADF